MTTEEQVYAIGDHYLSVEIFPGPEDPSGRLVGVRLRPYGKGAVKDTMVLASGATLAAALDLAYEKAEKGRFEPLDWKKRPWAVGPPTIFWGPKERIQFGP